MSTAWGLYCVECDDRSENWWVHDYGRSIVEQIVRAWPAIRAAKAACPCLEFGTEISPSEFPTIFEFLGGRLFGGEGEGHGAHKLMVRDEYGNKFEIRGAA